MTAQTTNTYKARVKYRPNSKNMIYLNIGTQIKKTEQYPLDIVSSIFTYYFTHIKLIHINIFYWNGFNLINMNSYEFDMFFVSNVKSKSLRKISIKYKY